MRAARPLRTLLVLAALVAGGGCGDAAEPFVCTADGAPRDCLVATQYCEIVTVNGNNTATCRALPSNCPAGSTLCACLLAPLDAQGATNESCNTQTLPGGAQTTLAYSR